MSVARPTDMMGPWQGLKTLWGMRRALPVFRAYRMPGADYLMRFRSPVLRRLLEFVPEMPASYFLVLLACLADGDLAGWSGGSRGFALALAKRLRDLGGLLSLRAPVARILVEGDRAVGVALEDGTEHEADVVVSAADARSTLMDLLGGRFVTPRWREALDRWPLFRPLVMVSLGVRSRFGEAPASLVVRLSDPIPCGPRPIESLSCRVFWWDPSVAPEGGTVVQATVETSWDHWAGLAAGDRKAYEDEKERIASVVVDRLEPYLPGLRGSIAATDVATPHTFWRYTRNHRGAYEGWLPTPETTGVRLERTLPGLHGFHMVGQWVQPGGGIPPALFDGRHLVMRLCRADRRPFVARPA
jgi:phytoene dehydrogenase-like protein